MKRSLTAPTSSARGTLRSVRRVLTIVFTATNAVGLILLTSLAIRLDAERGVQRLDGELRRVTLAAIQRLGHQGGAVSLADLAGSGLARQCPAFAVLPGTAAPFLGLQNRQDCPSVSLLRLNWYATRATKARRIVNGDGQTAGGRAVRILAEPFFRGNTVAGAVVATVDAEPEDTRHHRVVLLIALGCLIVVGAVALVGHLVSGRAMRPAATALDQQERFLAESAHDLRTPLAAMRALSETALDNPPQRDELLPRTVALSVRMGGIVDDLLIRARVAAGVAEVRRQPIRLDQMVASVVDGTPRGDASISFVGTESTVSADPNLVQRAVGNLLDNALKYGHPRDEPADVRVTVDGARVTVADSGPGMQVPLDAEPYAGIVSGTSASTGLGLSIVRWIAHAHGGSLTVHNSPDGGAVFVLTLSVSPP